MVGEEGFRLITGRDPPKSEFQKALERAGGGPIAEELERRRVGGGGGGITPQETREEEASRLSAERQANIEQERVRIAEEKAAKERESKEQEQREIFIKAKELGITKKEAKAVREEIKEAGRKAFEEGERKRRTRRQLQAVTKEAEEKRKPIIEKAILFREKVRAEDVKTETQREIFQQRVEQQGFLVTAKQFVKAGAPAAAVVGVADIAGAKFVKTTEPVFRKIFKEQAPTSGQVRAAGRRAGEIVSFTTIAPFTATTAQIERTLAQRTDVVFAGASQTKAKDIVKTDIAFVTSRGEKGVARGISQVVTKGRETMAKTIGAGVKIRRGIQIPTGKLVVKPQEKFIGAEISKTIQRDKRFAQISAGITKRAARRAEQIRFVSIGVGAQKEKQTIFIGGIAAERGFARIGGIIKQVPKTDKIITVSGKQAKGIISKKALSSVQSIVTAGVQTKPMQPIQKLATVGSVSTSLRVTTPKVVTKPKIITKQIQAPKVIEKTVTPTKQVVSTVSRTRQDTRQIQKLGLAQPQKIRTIQKIKTGQRVGQKQRIALVQKSQQKQKLRTPVPKIPLIFPKPPQRIPFLPQFFKAKRTIRQPKARFGVSVRRFGKFRPIGTGLPLQRAISLGRMKTGRTLAATFRITPERKGITIGGIRTPKGFKRKKGLTFIEMPKLRLSTAPEVKAIQIARRIKT